MTFALYPSLIGKVVFVSGGASGIGAEMVAAFVRNGARVAFVDLLKEEGEKLARHLSASGPSPLFLECDVTEIAALQGAIAAARKALGPIGVLINNAANDFRRAVAEVSVEFWDMMQDVNLRHHFFAAQAVQLHMRELGGGSIVNLSSIAWRAGAGEMPAYSSAKAGVVGLTRALARAFGADNIRVNAIEPGAVMTERQRKLWYRTQDSVDAIVQKQLIRSTLLGEDVARMALFLAADDSRMVTKQSIAVDAGLR